MKKVIRIVWISVLTGLAFLVACTSQGKLTREEKRQLKMERVAIEEMLNNNAVNSYDNLLKALEYKQWEMSQRMRLQDINSILCDQEALSQNKVAIDQLNEELNKIQRMIQESIPAPVYGPPSDYYEPPVNPSKKAELESQLREINNILREREGARVYGSPEILERRRQETDSLRKKAQDLQEQLQNLED